MPCLRTLRTAAACLVVLAAAGTARSAPAPAERSGLDQVPASAPIVVHVRGARGTRDRFVAMMENALPDVLKKIRPAIDDFFENGLASPGGRRKLRGLKADGPVFFVFTEMPKPADNPPKLAVIAAVTSYKEFRDGLLTDDERNGIKVNGNGVEATVIQNETTYFVDRKGYVVVTPNEEVANSFTKKQAGLDGRMSKELAAKLMAADVGLFLSMDTLNKEYAEQIKQARQGVEQLIDLGAAQSGNVDKKYVEMAKGMVGPVFQAVEDSQGFLFTVEFRPGGLALHVQSEVRAGTPTASTLQQARPADFKELAGMPEGRAKYTALKTTAQLYKSLGWLLLGTVPDKEAEAVNPVVDELSKAGPGIRLDAASLPPSDIQVCHFDDPNKAVEAQLKLLKAMGAGGTIQWGTLKEKPVVKANAQKYGPFELHSVELVWDLDKMAENAASGQGEDVRKKVAAAMKDVRGERLRLWLGTDGKAVVTVSATDWEAARALLDQYFKGAKTVGSVGAFRDVRKEMPAQASFLAVIDAVQYLGSVAEVLKPMFGGALQQGWPVMPGKGTAAFVGLSVTLTPERGSLDTFISAAAAREFYKAFVKPVLGG